MGNKFDGLTPGELDQYQSESEQQSGETDVAWAQRVQQLEARWLAVAGGRRAAQAEAPGTEA